MAVTASTLGMPGDGARDEFARSPRHGAGAGVRAAASVLAGGGIPARERTHRGPSLATTLDAALSASIARTTTTGER